MPFIHTAHVDYDVVFVGASMKYLFLHSTASIVSFKLGQYNKCVFIIVYLNNII